MDMQLKRGLLEICVLAILNQGDSYGYQIVKDADACVELSESTLYPILRRLETALEKLSDTDAFHEFHRLRIRVFEHGE